MISLKKNINKFFFYKIAPTRLKNQKQSTPVSWTCDSLVNYNLFTHNFYSV